MSHIMSHIGLGMPRVTGLPHGQPGPMKPVIPMMPPPPPMSMKGHPFHNVHGQQGGQRPGPPPPGQVISVEELEGRSPSVPSPSGGDPGVPRPDVQAKILNLTRQKSDFEQKQNANANMRERMMLLQHQKPAPPMVYPQQLPQRGQGPGGVPFDMSGPPPLATGGGRHGLNGHPTGPPPPLPLRAGGQLTHRMGVSWGRADLQWRAPGT